MFCCLVFAGRNCENYISTHALTLLSGSLRSFPHGRSEHNKEHVGSPGEALGTQWYMSQLLKEVHLSYRPRSQMRVWGSSEGDMGWYSFQHCHGNQQQITEE